MWLMFSCTLFIYNSNVSVPFHSWVLFQLPVMTPFSMPIVLFGWKALTEGWLSNFWSRGITWRSWPCLIDTNHSELILVSFLQSIHITTGLCGRHLGHLGPTGAESIFLLDDVIGDVIPTIRFWCRPGKFHGWFSHVGDWRDAWAIWFIFILKNKANLWIKNI